jgi:hypothetical protein
LEWDLVNSQTKKMIILVRNQYRVFQSFLNVLFRISTTISEISHLKCFCFCFQVKNLSEEIVDQIELRWRFEVVLVV